MHLYLRLLLEYFVKVVKQKGNFQEYLVVMELIYSLNITIHQKIQIGISNY